MCVALVLVCKYGFGGLDRGAQASGGVEGRTHKQRAVDKPADLHAPRERGAYTRDYRPLDGLTFLRFLLGSTHAVADDR